MISALANHLFQSTIFAAIAGLLSVALRDNRARTRYWLWAIASFKFLIPLSLLAEIGRSLSPSAPVAPMPSPIAIAIGEIGHPFSTQAAAPAPYTFPISTLLLAIWVAGSASVLLYWLRKWKQAMAAPRAAQLPLSGREAASLRRVLRLAGLRTPIRLALSGNPIEPAIFGLFRPVILLPAGVADHLDDDQLDAILAHELCHLKHRDNLFAAIHMLVSAIFWFHPLIWWIGAKIVEERERACDEYVVQLGAEPEAYGEAILKICRFCLQSPLVCAAGIGGANLTTRIEEIVSNSTRRNLGFAKKLMLVAAAACSLASPVAFGFFADQNQAASQWQIDGVPIDSAATAAKTPAFEVASIKPSSPDSQLKVDFAAGGKLFITNATLRFLIKIAYNISDDQLQGGPAWVSSRRFDLGAKPATSLGGDPQSMTKEQVVAFHAPVRLRLQRLLADRFQLALRKESTPMPVFALVVAKGGPKKLTASRSTDDPKINSTFGRGILSATATDIPTFVSYLSEGQVGRPVIDETGLTGKYNFHLEWTPDPGLNPANPNQQTPADPNGVSIFTALQQQLGLKLEPRTANADRLVIVDAQLPSAN